MKKPIINLHGAPGTGKSETSKLLVIISAGRLNFETRSTGRIARDIALNHGCPEAYFDTFPKFAREHGINYDQEIDNALAKLGYSKKPLIIDSRLGYHFIPGAFNVLLRADEKIAATRVKNDEKRSESKKSLDEIIEGFRIREDSDRQKYIDLYGTDYQLDSNYHLIIDTSKIEMPFVANKICNDFFVWFKSEVETPV